MVAIFSITFLYTQEQKMLFCLKLCQLYRKLRKTPNNCVIPPSLADTNRPLLLSE